MEPCRSRCSWSSSLCVGTGGYELLPAATQGVPGLMTDTQLHRRAPPERAPDDHDGPDGANDDRPRPGRVLYSRAISRSEEHTSELQSRGHLVCRLLLEKKKE